MIGWIHCFETKVDRLSCDRDCHLGVARKQKEGEDGRGQAAARNKMFFHSVLAMTRSPASLYLPQFYTPLIIYSDF